VSRVSADQTALEAISHPPAAPRQAAAVTSARFFRDESELRPRATDANLPIGANVASMVQIHQGLRARMRPWLPPLVRDLAKEDMARHGIKQFSPWAADVTAIQFGRPELARKLTVKPPKTLFFEEHGLVPIPPEEDYVDCYMRLWDPLHTYVEDLGKQAMVTTPQCVINGLAHHLGCVEILPKHRQEALIHVA
jgi:broad specificity phosphatase PhoE